MNSKPSLADDYLAGNPAILARFASPPSTWPVQAARREGAGCPRLTLDDVQEIRSFNQAAGAPPEALASVEKLVDPRARVVITGQQAGIGLGPLFTLYKAIGAILLARQAEERLGAPVVPLFWIASEDHDFEEIRTVRWLSHSGAIESFTYTPAAPVANRSVGDIVIEPSLSGLLDRLEATTMDTEFRPAALEWLGSSFRAGGTLEVFFARLILSLLGRFGLATIAPHFAFLRRGAASLFRQEIENPREMSRRLIEAGKALHWKGYPTPLHRHPDDINFFLYEKGLRGKMAWEGDGIVVESGNEILRRSSAHDLLREVEADPRRISCNVATRPLCQDASLPTLAYVAGPGELAYFAQLREVYEAARVFMPVISLRPRVALVDARTRRFIEKTGLLIQTLLYSTREEIARRLAQRNDADGVLEVLDGGAALLAEGLAQLRATLPATSPAVEKAIERLADSQGRGLAAVRSRLEQELTRRDEALHHQLERVESWLRPEGHPQERVFSVLAPLLINHGTGAIDRMMEVLDPNQAELQVVNL